MTKLTTKTQKTNHNKLKEKQKMQKLNQTTVICKNWSYVYMCTSLYTTVVHNTRDK